MFLFDGAPMLGGGAPEPDRRMERRQGESDEGYAGRMARLFETDLARRLTSFLFAGGLFFLGTDLAMFFVAGRVEGTPDFPLMPLWGPILGLGVVLLGVRILRRLSKPRRPKEPITRPTRPNDQLVGPEERSTRDTARGA